MFNTNPFSDLTEIISPFAMLGFIIAMIFLIVAGTVIQMINHKNLTYFITNAKKAKLAATKELGLGEKTSIIAKTTVVDMERHPNLVLVNEDWLMFLVCMEQFYSGYLLQF